MNMRQKIGNLPLWKAAVITALAFIFTSIAIEEFIMSRIFNVLDNTIAAFEAQSKSDDEDMEKDFRDEARFEKEGKEFSQSVSKSLDGSAGNR